MKAANIFDRVFFRFIIAGIINTLAGSAIMFVFYNFAHAGYWVSSACNYFITSVLSFFLNKYFTFGVRRRSFAMIVSFAVVIALSYLIAYGAARPAVNYLLGGASRKVRENAALLAGMCLFTGLNYLGQRLFVFNRGDAKEEAKREK